MAARPSNIPTFWFRPDPSFFGDAGDGAGLLVPEPVLPFEAVFPAEEWAEDTLLVDEVGDGHEEDVLTASWPASPASPSASSLGSPPDPPTDGDEDGDGDSGCTVLAVLQRSIKRRTWRRGGDAAQWRADRGVLATHRGWVAEHLPQVDVVACTRRRATAAASVPAQAIAELVRRVASREFAQAVLTLALPLTIRRCARLGGTSGKREEGADSTTGKQEDDDSTTPPCCTACHEVLVHAVATCLETASSSTSSASEFRTLVQTACASVAAWPRLVMYLQRCFIAARKAQLGVP